MNREQAEIAKAVIDVRDRSMSPHYEELMGRFGELALNNIQTERLRQEPEVRANNEALVREFLDLLLQADPNTRYKAFVVPTAQEARLIQSSVLFMHGAASEEYHLHDADRSARVPLYLLGTKPNVNISIFTQGKLPDVLLLTARAFGDHEFRILGTWWPELRAIEDKQIAIETSWYSEEQIKEMFNEKAQQLLVGAFDEDSMTFEQQTRDINRSYPKRKRERLTPAQRVAHKVSKYGHVITGGPMVNWHNTNFNPEERDCSFTDDFLVNYCVLEHMGDLATKFGLLEDLKSIIDRHTIDLIDPMDNLLEETD